MRGPVLLFLVTSLWVVGCDGGDAKRGEMALLEEQGDPGANIAAGVARLHASPRGSVCDLQAHDVQTRVVAEIQARRVGIARYQRALGEAAKGGAIAGQRIGPLTIVAPMTHSLGGKSFEYGWHDIASDLRHADSLKHREVFAYWHAMYMNAQMILLDDYNRRMARLSMSLDAKTLPAARSLERALFACLGDESCAALGDTGGGEKLNPQYQRFYSQLSLATSLQRKRLIMADFAEQVTRDVSSRRFAPNDGLVAMGDTWTVPLDAGDFQDDKEALAAIIEDIWQSSQVKVKIRWTSSDDEPEAFRFVAHAYAGRAFVSRWSRTINIFSGDSTKAIGHEFGHVLGLPDHYYTTWNDETCTYRTVLDSEDIMSSHESGSVTPELWRELQAVYGTP